MRFLQPLLFFAFPPMRFQEVIEVTVSHAKIRIHSVIDDASMDFEYTGEYAFKDSTHLIVYTDYTGNDITKCAIQANTSGILLHRSGAFSGDMFFTLENPTVVDYQADMPTARENQLIFIEKPATPIRGSIRRWRTKSLHSCRIGGKTMPFKAAQLTDPEKADDDLRRLRRATIVEGQQTTPDEELIRVSFGSRHRCRSVPASRYGRERAGSFREGPGVHPFPRRSRTARLPHSMRKAIGAGQRDDRIQRVCERNRANP